MTALYIVWGLKDSLNSTWSTTDSASVSSLMRDRIREKETIVPNVATKTKWHRRSTTSQQALESNSARPWFRPLSPCWLLVSPVGEARERERLLYYAEHPPSHTLPQDCNLRLGSWSKTELNSGHWARLNIISQWHVYYTAKYVCCEELVKDRMWGRESQSSTISKFSSDLHCVFIPWFVQNLPSLFSWIPSSFLITVYAHYSIIADARFPLLLTS